MLVDVDFTVDCGMKRGGGESVDISTIFIKHPRINPIVVFGRFQTIYFSLLTFDCWVFNYKNILYAFEFI